VGAGGVFQLKIGAGDVGTMIHASVPILWAMVQWCAELGHCVPVLLFTLARSVSRTFSCVIVSVGVADCKDDRRRGDNHDGRRRA
jgi:hypothetical protein